MITILVRVDSLISNIYGYVKLEKSSRKVGDTFFGEKENVLESVHEAWVVLKLVRHC